MGKQWKQWETLFLRAPKSLQMVTAALKLKDACSLEKNYDKPWQHIKKQRHYFANTGPSSWSLVFPVVMYGYESWTIKRAEHRRIDALELWCWRRILRVPWTARRSNQSILLLWPPDAKNWLIGKDPDAGKDWGQEEKGMTEDDRVGWHHRLNGHEFGWTPWIGDGQGGLACCSPWGHRVGHDWATELNWMMGNVCW